MQTKLPPTHITHVLWRELTHAGWELPGPVVILLADAHRGANEPETWIALVNYRVPVAKVFTDHLTVHNPFRRTAVASWGKNIENIYNIYKYNENLKSYLSSKSAY